MRRIKKTVIIIVSIVVTFLVALTIVFWMANGELFFMAPSYNKVNRYLKANINELSYVANVLFEMDYDFIEIRKDPLREEDKYNMRVSRKYVPIPDELVGHIQNLYDSGVSVISCGQNSINFTMWSTMDESRGIIYSRTGKSPDGEQLITVKQLLEENWFYYVHNYEKAKEQNPDMFM